MLYNDLHGFTTQCCLAAYDNLDSQMF